MDPKDTPKKPEREGSQSDEFGFTPARVFVGYTAQPLPLKWGRLGLLTHTHFRKPTQCTTDIWHAPPGITRQIEKQVQY